MSKEDKYKEYAKVVNPIAFIGVKKDEFKKAYKGVLKFDLDDVWSYIVKHRPKQPKNDKAEEVD